MEVPLDGPNRPAQCLGQGLHLGPAQATLIVGVVRESAVGRDGLGGYSGEGEVLDLGDPGKFGLVWHCRLLFAVRRCALMIEFTKAAGSRAKGNAPPLFLCTFSVAYFTYTGILALAPVLTAQTRTIVPLPHSRLHPSSSNCLVLILRGRPLSYTALRQRTEAMLYRNPPTRVRSLSGRSVVAVRRSRAALTAAIRRALARSSASASPAHAHDATSDHRHNLFLLRKCDTGAGKLPGPRSPAMRRRTLSRVRPRRSAISAMVSRSSGSTRLTRRPGTDSTSAI